MGDNMGPGRAGFIDKIKVWVGLGGINKKANLKGHKYEAQESSSSFFSFFKTKIFSEGNAANKGSTQHKYAAASSGQEGFLTKLFSRVWNLLFNESAKPAGERALSGRESETFDNTLLKVTKEEQKKADEETCGQLDQWVDSQKTEFAGLAGHIRDRIQGFLNKENQTCLDLQKLSRLELLFSPEIQQIFQANPRLQTLKELDISNLIIPKGFIEKMLILFPHLQLLDAQNCNISDIQSLLKFSELQKLNLRGCQVSTLPRKVASYSDNLTHLILEGNKLKQEDVNFCGVLARQKTGIQEIDISNQKDGQGQPKTLTYPNKLGDLSINSQQGGISTVTKQGRYHHT